MRQLQGSNFSFKTIFCAFNFSESNPQFLILATKEFTLNENKTIFVTISDSFSKFQSRCTEQSDLLALFNLIYLIFVIKRLFPKVLQLKFEIITPSLQRTNLSMKGIYLLTKYLKSNLSTLVYENKLCFKLTSSRSS